MPLPILPALAGLASLFSGSQTTVTTNTSLAADVSPSIQVVVQGAADSGIQSEANADGTATASPTQSAGGAPISGGGLGFTSPSYAALTGGEYDQNASLFDDPLIVGGAIILIAAGVWILK